MIRFPFGPSFSIVVNDRGGSQEYTKKFLATGPRVGSGRIRGENNIIYIYNTLQNSKDSRIEEGFGRGK